MIKLNELISEINWSDLDNIIIKTENGTIYETKKILCTISLGYLKANHRSLFKPNLPTKKINSIGAFYSKVFLKILNIFTFY